MISDKFLDALEAVLPQGIENAKKSDWILSELFLKHGIETSSRAIQNGFRALLIHRQIPCGATPDNGYFLPITKEGFERLQKSDGARLISISNRIEARNIAWRNRKQQALGIEDSEAHLPPSTLTTGQNEYSIRVSPSERRASPQNPQTKATNPHPEGANGKLSYFVLRHIGLDYLIGKLDKPQVEEKYGISWNTLRKFVKDYGEKHDVHFRPRGPKTNPSPTFDDYEMLESWNLACDDWEKDRLIKEA